MRARRVLWAATVRTKTLTNRIAAAVEGRFGAVSVFPLDLRRWADEGIPPVAVGKALRDAGLVVAALDPFTQWVPHWEPPASMSSEDRAFVDFDEHTILAYAEALGVEAINCVEPFGQRHEEPALVDALGGFAARAKSRGFRVALEFMPISGIPDLATGRRLVETANTPSLGLVFDVWHFVRSGSSLAELETLDGDRVFEVQLADGRDPMTGADVFDDLLHHRLLPGDGDFPIRSIMEPLAQIKALRSLGPEIFSDAIDGLDAREAGRRAGESINQWSLT